MVTVLVALTAGGIVSLLADENPFKVYSILFSGSFGSIEAIGYTLFYATPFIFTGLAVAIPYRVGLFNIGAEGQLYFAAIALAAMAFYFPSAGIFSFFLAIAAAILGGALFAALPGIFKAYRGSHEVITTIMLNFVAMSLSNYLILYAWKDPGSQRPETIIFSESTWIPLLHLGDSPLNYSFILALISAVSCWFFLEKTDLGFQLRAVGQNPSAAKVAGFSVKKCIVLSMMIGGAMASGVAMNEILGNAHRLRDGFSQGYGFIGIAVAFLGRGNPIGIIFSAIFFGALYRGAGELEIETHRMTRDFATVMQAIFIAAVGCEGLVALLLNKLKKKKGDPK